MIARNRITLAALVLAVTLAAGCGGGAADPSAPAPSQTEAVGDTDAPSTIATVTTSRPPADPRVERWARRWSHTIAVPMAHAATTLAAVAPNALKGRSRALNRLTAAMSTLTNCGTRLDHRVGAAPPSLVRAKALTRRACRAFSLGIGAFAHGFNTGSFPEVAHGLDRDGALLLRRAGLAVQRATTTA